MWGMALHVNVLHVCCLLVGGCSQEVGQVQQVVLQLRHQEPEGTETVLLNTTFQFLDFNHMGRSRSLPLIFLLNGFNCQSFEYSQLLSDLASRGYLTVVTDFRHRTHLPLPQREPQGPGCPSDSYLVPTSSILDTVLKFAKAAVEGNGTLETPKELVAAFKVSNRDQVVLVGHSAGGLVGFSMVADERQTSVTGAILYEGYSVGEHSIPEGRFVSFLAGAYNDRTEEAYHNTSGCKSFVRLKKCNHYGITDYFANSKHQIAQCGQQAPSDPVAFRTTKKTQDQIVGTIAHTVDAIARAYVLHDEDSKMWVIKALPNEEMVSETDIVCEGFEH